MRIVDSIPVAGKCREAFITRIAGEGGGQKSVGSGQWAVSRTNGDKQGDKQGGRTSRVELSRQIVWGKRAVSGETHCPLFVTQTVSLRCALDVIPKLTVCATRTQTAQSLGRGKLCGSINQCYVR